MTLQRVVWPQMWAGRCSSRGLNITRPEVESLGRLPRRPHHYTPLSSYQGIQHIGTQSVFFNTVVQSSLVGCNLGSSLPQGISSAVDLAVQLMPRRKRQQRGPPDPPAKQHPRALYDPCYCLLCWEYLESWEWYDHARTEKHLKYQEESDKWWRSKGYRPPR